MANITTAVVISNLALVGRVYASSQELTMPAANILTPHPSERWRSTSGSDYVVLDKLDAAVADSIVFNGLTCGVNSTVRLRLSLSDSAGVAGDVLDVSYADGSGNFETIYGTVSHLLASPLAWRYARLDGTDPDADFFEVGLATAGVRESFTYNFAPGAGIQYIDRSRIGGTAAGLTLTSPDNTFRRVDLNFEWVTQAQRYDLIETMDRVNGRHVNVLLILDTASDNLARDSIVGLVTDLTPNTYHAAIEIFGKQLRLDQRV